MDINQVLQLALQNLQQSQSPLVQASIGNYKKLSPEQRRQLIDQNLSVAMGLTLPVTKAKIPTQKSVNASVLINRLKGLTGEDRNIMGLFGQMVEKSPRGNLGRVGKDAQSIATGLGLKPTLSNKQLLNSFNNILEFADRVNISPKQEATDFFIKKLL